MIDAKGIGKIGRNAKESAGMIERTAKGLANHRDDHLGVDQDLDLDRDPVLDRMMTRDRKMTLNRTGRFIYFKNIMMLRSYYY